MRPRRPPRSNIASTPAPTSTHLPYLDPLAVPAPYMSGMFARQCVTPGCFATYYIHALAAKYHDPGLCADCDIKVAELERLAVLEYPRNIAPPAEPPEWPSLAYVADHEATDPNPRPARIPWADTIAIAISQEGQ